MLFQAMLFAWHHHPLPFASRSASTTVTVAAAGQGIPELADHDCDICFVIGHHGAVPAGLFAAAPPQLAPLSRPAPPAFVGYLAPYLLFHPRAPPRV
jgi:hypothetical protein